jgi:hypothetical protein
VRQKGFLWEMAEVFFSLFKFYSLLEHFRFLVIFPMK